MNIQHYYFHALLRTSGEHLHKFLEPVLTSGRAEPASPLSPPDVKKLPDVTGRGTLWQVNGVAVKKNQNGGRPAASVVVLEIFWTR